jgi:hypothetical protein
MNEDQFMDDINGGGYVILPSAGPGEGEGEVEIPAIDIIAEAIDTPASNWNSRCHEISLRVVRTGLLGEPGPACRVVRGVASGYNIGGQHSWIALGYPYDPDTIYLDVTAHTWGKVEGIVVTTAGEAFENFMGDRQGHAAHGYDPRSIWEYGRPSPGYGKPIELDTSELSGEARTFLKILGPLDAKGWEKLGLYPKGAWPYRDVVNAIAEQLPKVAHSWPIDILGNGTDTNPGDIYW